MKKVHRPGIIFVTLLIYEEAHKLSLAQIERIEGMGPTPAYSYFFSILSDAILKICQAERIYFLIEIIKEEMNHMSSLSRELETLRHQLI